jgi:hypothetical protein
MFHWPSGRPVTHKSSNKYQYNRKARQAHALIRNQRIKDIQKSHLLDLNIEELDLLLNTI